MEQIQNLFKSYFEYSENAENVKSALIEKIQESCKSKFISRIFVKTQISSLFPPLTAYVIKDVISIDKFVKPSDEYKDGYIEVRFKTASIKFEYTYEKYSCETSLYTDSKVFYISPVTGEVLDYDNIDYKELSERYNVIPTDIDGNPIYLNSEVNIVDNWDNNPQNADTFIVYGTSMHSVKLFKKDDPSQTSCFLQGYIRVISPSENKN